MKLAFHNDSPIGQAVGRILELVGLNLLWMALCLPVVTAGAATCALHFVLSPLRVIVSSGYNVKIQSSF